MNKYEEKYLYLYLKLFNFYIKKKENKLNEHEIICKNNLLTSKSIF